MSRRLGLEDVNAHGGIDGVGIEGRAEGGGGRLLLEAEDLAVLAHFDNAEARDFIRRDGQRGQGDLGVGVLVVGQHAAVVHFVDVVAGEDDDVLGLLAADGVDVLVDGVRSAHVPVGAGALHGRHELKELAQFLGHNAGPAFADMAVERERLVLGEDVDAAQAGVDAVGESDVDDAVMAAKGHGGFGTVAGERKEPFPAPPASNTPSVSFISIRPRFDGLRLLSLNACDRMTSASLSRTERGIPHRATPLHQAPPKGGAIPHQDETGSPAVLEMQLPGLFTAYAL